MKKQLFFPKRSDMRQRNTCSIPTLGIGEPDGTYERQGRDWQKQHTCRENHFVLSVLESYSTMESVSYTRQEDYVKVNFWLSGRHTTVLDGFGQHDHDRPEVFITAGPPDMVKVDLCNKDTHLTSVAVCFLREFFPSHMGLDPEQLPEPLRGLCMPGADPYAFFRLPLTPDLMAAARAVLAAPAAVRREPVYIEAKGIELMYLLIDRMRSMSTRGGRCEISGRHQDRLYDAREWVTRRHAESISLDEIAKAVGLNKMALTGGFRELFGMSVFDWRQKTRMERAYELLQDSTNTIAQAAAAVGYRHTCNFSTAFHAYFGFTPQTIRGRQS